MVNIEDLTDDELKRLQEEFRRIREAEGPIVQPAEVCTDDVGNKGRNDARNEP